MKQNIYYYQILPYLKNNTYDSFFIIAAPLFILKFFNNSLSPKANGV